MLNTKRLIAVLLVLVGGLVLTGCATVQAPPELVKAIEAGNLSKVESILAENPKLVNARDKGIKLGYCYQSIPSPGSIGTPLHLAVCKNKKRIVKLLIAKGADVNAKESETHLTPLHCSATHGYKEITKLLIENGANLNTKDDYGYTPLCRAIFMASEASVFQGSTGLRFSELCPTINWGGHKEVTELLIQNGADVRKTSKGGRSPLHSAAEVGWVQVAKKLIENGADVNTKGLIHGQRNWTPLHVAVQRGQKALVELLITNGADVNAKGTIRWKTNWTPLHEAVQRGRKALVELLITNGAKVNAKDEDGNTPLHLAAERGYLEIVKILIEHGAKVNTENSGYILGDYRNILGIKCYKKIKSWDTPLALAIKNNHNEVAELLRKNGAVEDVPNGLLKSIVEPFVEPFRSGEGGHREDYLDIPARLINNFIP